tara:strand:- start:1365 stop:3692 length:2328 start_codon:yes stop_codon:yes gene_type:complete
MKSELKTHHNIKQDFNSKMWDICKKDRMFFYVWFDKNDPLRTKFGQRWVKAGLDPVVDCKKRIYESLQVVKYKAYDGDIVMVQIFDVSEMAKEDGQFNIKAKYDDFIRNQIGYIHHSEVHNLPAVDFIIKLNNLFAKRKKGKITANLSTAQYIGTAQVVKSLKTNNVLLLNQCPRYGKTITSPIPALETGTKLIIVTSYVKTSFASFIKDIGTFNNFDDVVCVNSEDKDWKKQVNENLKDDKTVMVFVSLCYSIKRKDRLSFLMNKKMNKHLIVDEADYGAHTEKQSSILIELYNKNKSNTKVLLMTGSNADRAVSKWKVEDIISVLYMEMLDYKDMSKTSKQKLISNYTLSDNWSWSSKRDDLLVDINLYQADMSPVATKAIADGMTSDEFKTLPNWSGPGQNAQKNKGIWINLFEMIKNGMVPALNVDDQTEKYDGKCKTEMMFVSANNKNMKIIDKLANDCYKNTKFNTNVITLCGDIRINGKKIKQENAEKVVTQFVEKSYAENKHVMIISNIIGQRSFSEKEITNLFLCYDNGEKGATQQKMARALTSGQEEKIANIISLSFDPNRDDKFVEMFMETAKSKMKKNPNIKSLNQAMNEIIPLVSMYVFGEDGNRVVINKSEYMRKFFDDKEVVKKIIGRTSDLFALSDEWKLEVSGGPQYQQDKTEKVEKGKAKDSKPRESNSTISTRKKATIDILCRRAIIKAFDNLTDLLYYTSKKTLGEAIEACRNNKNAREGILLSFGLRFEVIEELYRVNIFNNDIASLIHENRAK